LVSKLKPAAGRDALLTATVKLIIWLFVYPVTGDETMTVVALLELP
jgi:hypothetical protein